MANEASQMPFIKNLASSDRKLRTASLESLQTFVASRAALPPTDALKLWKGLYYALWMTDRPLPQQALARDLAALVHRLRPACVDAWLRGFWAVMALQWTDIDVLRMEKFLLLVRRVFAAHVRWAADQQYDAARVDLLLAVLADGCFEPAGDLRRVPVGVRLHVLDLWVDELDREGALAEPRARPLLDGLRRLVDALRTCPVKSVRERARDSLEDERLPWVEKTAESEGEDLDVDGKDASGDDGSWDGIDD
ncbi:hypothetical protein S40288_05903 [Stachybotrys chartarum IBT 40288]|nr:hypothetical protein S40288_05903 [Stachybotrys chartarum IBT 40288]